MQAREFFDAARDADLILQLAAYKGADCVGRGRSLIVDQEHCIAVMLENCGDPAESGFAAGDMVSYFLHPEAEARISGNPARGLTAVPQ